MVLGLPPSSHHFCFFFLSGHLDLVVLRNFRILPFIFTASLLTFGFIRISLEQVTQTASFKDDLQLDILDNNQVIIAVEEEFAVDIPENEANKISTTAHLIDYLTAHPQAK